MIAVLLRQHYLCKKQKRKEREERKEKRKK